MLQQKLRLLVLVFSYPVSFSLIVATVSSCPPYVVNAWANGTGRLLKVAEAIMPHRNSLCNSKSATTMHRKTLLHEKETHSKGKELCISYRSVSSEISNLGRSRIALKRVLKWTNVMSLHFSSKFSGWPVVPTSSPATGRFLPYGVRHNDFLHQSSTNNPCLIWGTKQNK